MMRILVLQTTRMGDMIQTSPLIHEIREKHPDAHIAVMVRRMGKVIAERHPDIDEVTTYDEDTLYLQLKANDSDRLLKAYNEADERIQQLKNGNYDLVYNITHSVASAMMLKLAGIPKVIGAHLSDDWQFLQRGSWTRYFFTGVFSREYNDLNLCDITRNFVSDAPPCRKLVFEIRDEDREFVTALLQEHGVDEEDFVVCFQLGASEENKRWSEKRFAELAKLLRESRNAKIFLLGITEEAPLGDVLAEHAPGAAVPLYGKTNIPQVAALLERSNALVTNDTGTMHIAAAAGCPIVLVSVGNVHYRETGPYGEGHCAIECRRKTLGRSDYVPGGIEERDQILPEQVLRALEMTLDESRGGPLQQIEESEELADVDLYITRFAPDGCLQFYPVVRRPMTERDFVRIAYRAMWLDHLDSKNDKRAERESIALMMRHFSGPAPDTLRQWTQDNARVFHKLAEMMRRGVRTTESLLDALKKNKGMAQAKQEVTELMALDEEARIFSEVNPACRPLILMARFERNTLEGADPKLLAETTLDIYRACFARARLTAKKIEQIAEIREHVTGS